MKKLIDCVISMNCDINNLINKNYF